jgi:hypothetical protein
MNKKLILGKNDSQSKTSPKYSANSNKEKNFLYKRNQVIQKIHLFLKNKFSKLFKDKDYSETNLLSDLNDLVSNEDIKKFDHNAMIMKLEKIILEIIKNRETKIYQGLPDMSKINSLIAIHSQNKNSSSQDINKDNIHSINNSNSNTNLKSDIINKFNEEKYNQINNQVNSKQDEWALIAKYNDIKHQEEIKNKKIQENEQKKKQKEFLEKQIQEKEALKIKEKEDFRNFFNAQIKNEKEDIPKHSKTNSQLNSVSDHKIIAKSNLPKENYENQKYLKEQEEKEKS